MQPPVIPKGDFSLPFLATLDSAVNQQGAQMDAWNHMAAPGRKGRTYNCYNLLDNNNLYTVPDVQDPSGTMFAGFKGMGIDAIGSVITGRPSGCFRIEERTDWSRKARMSQTFLQPAFFTPPKTWRMRWCGKA